MAEPVGLGSDANIDLSLRMLHVRREVEIGRRVLATHKPPHHETSCYQLEREPNHAAQ